MPKLIVESFEEGLTLLDFLQRRIPTASRSYLRQLLNKGKVHGGNEPLTETARLETGTVVHLPESRRLKELRAASEEAVHILFESREILVVEKPPGLAVHAGIGHERDNLTARLQDLMTARGERFRVAPVHRLDLDTSGPVLFGKGRQACGLLGRLFMDGAIEKRYLALVAGQTEERGILHSILSAKGKRKEARTAYRVVRRGTTATLLELTLYTGRQHQIRRQCAEQGHPLFGDRRYGGPCRAGLSRTFLHGSRLAFTDPFRNAAIEIDCPLSVDLAAALALLLPQNDS